MRIMKLTGLVVFVAAVFLTLAGSNQLITDSTKVEAPRPYNSATESTSGAPTETAADDSAESNPETPVDSTKRPGGSAKRRTNLLRKNSANSSVWQNHKGGKWVVETKWDGQKWVTKRVYYPSNKE